LQTQLGRAIHGRHEDDRDSLAAGGCGRTVGGGERDREDERRRFGCRALCRGLGARPEDTGRSERQVGPRLRGSAGPQRLQHHPCLLQRGPRAPHGRGRDGPRSIRAEREGRLGQGHRHARVRRREGRVVHDSLQRVLVLGRQEAPRDLQGLRLHAAEDRRAKLARRPARRVRQPRSDALHPSRVEAGDVLLEDDELHVRLPVRPVRELAEHLLEPLPGSGARRPGLQHDLDELHLRLRRQARVERPVLPVELHQRPGLDPDGEPVLLREEAWPRRGRLQDRH
jgi:hypothetical protein